MKKLLILALVAVLVGSFAFTAVGKGKPVCDGHECYIDQGCADGVCWAYKCCRDEYLYKGKCVWTDYLCVSILP